MEEIEIELDDDELLVLFKEAHRRDMKFNDLIIEILTEYIEKMK